MQMIGNIGVILDGISNILSNMVAMLAEVFLMISKLRTSVYIILVVCKRIETLTTLRWK